jgi:plastocyanin
MRRRVLGPILGLALLLTACSSASGESTPASTTPKRVLGETVAVEQSGFAPQWTIVQVGGTVTFRNTTSASQQIVFDNARDASGAPLQSPPIEAGGTWRWTADSFASFAYHSPGLPGASGRIQVEPPAEPD